MSLISEFPIAGPQGKQGPIGPQGKQGPEGKRGPMGPAGPGTGDMLAMVYDPQGKAIDVYKYTDDAAAGRADLTLSNLSNKQKALRNIGGRPNRNLLDNWYFPQAVNQRGAASWSGGGYHLDRWYEEQNVAGSIGTDGYHIGTGQTAIQRYSEEEMNQLLGKTITISCLLSDGSFATATGTLPDELTENFNIMCYPKSGFAFTMALFYSAKSYQFGRISNGSGSEITVVACKTELGPTQTLAYRDEDGNWQLFETPDYGEELAKCQRYYARYGIAAGNGQIGYTMAASPTIANAIIFLPGPMRIINPTVRFSGTVVLRSGVTDIPVSGMTINAVINNAAYIQVTASGLESGKMYVLRISNGYIDFDADF